MKKLYTITAILTCILFMLSSCTKQSANEMVAPLTSDVIKANISPNQSYQFIVNNTDNVTIEKQALHFKISKTEQDAKGIAMVYKYLPAQDYIGTEEIILSSKKIININTSTSCGSGSNYHTDNTLSSTSTSYTNIKLNISN